MTDRLLQRLGLDPRQFRALVAALVTMDLRGQHFARAVGAPAGKLEVLSPLFWVVGQCLALSAATSLFLFARTDVWFFAFVNLTFGVTALATTVLVEFQEVVTDPRDLDVVGPRPVGPRTYAAARFANLGFYVLLMATALHLVPLVAGAGLADAGPGYAPAYFVAAAAGSLVAVALVVAAMALAGTGPGAEWARTVLAWTQIVLLGVAVYGGQLMLRDGTAAVQVWGAFLPESDWVWWVPTAWLARFVERAAVAPTPGTLAAGGGLLALGLAAAAGAVWRVGRLHAGMQPLGHDARPRPLPAGQLGGVGGWLTRLAGGGTPEGRAGFWLARRLLARDGDLAMRCVMPFATPVAVTVLAVAGGQFANPLEVRDARLVALPVLALGLVALAGPPVVYNLTFARDHAAAWLLGSAPVASPGAFARGAARAAWLTAVAPLCAAYGLTAWAVWGDALAAAMHAALGALMAWPLALAGAAALAPGLPFSRPPARGGAFAPIAVPMLGLGSAVLFVGTLHLLYGHTAWFWLAAALGSAAAAWPLERAADARQRRLARGGLA